VKPERVIERMAQLHPGRRGFGSADPVEAAAFRRALRGDHDLNPGMTPPSTALRPAAVLVPLIDHADGMAVLLTQRTAHLSAHAGQISFPGGKATLVAPQAAGQKLGARTRARCKNGHCTAFPTQTVSVVGRMQGEC